MAGRQITKEHARKLVKKLGAVAIISRNQAHDEYEVSDGDIVVGIIRIRRSSEKDKGHDYIPGNLHISPHQAKELANCPMSRDEYIECMRQKGVLPGGENDETIEPEE